MKQVFKSLMAMAVFTTAFISLSSFIAKKKTTTVSAYSIVLVSKNIIGTNSEWTWCVTNPNPGNGDGETLQDISHWSMPLSPAAEEVLLSAHYSFDGVTFHTATTSVERDPSIRYCTSEDVLKFDVGTTGSAPTYYRATFSADFTINPFATSWVKTGGGRQGCNVQFFEGTGSRLF